MLTISSVVNAIKIRWQAVPDVRTGKPMESNEATFPHKQSTIHSKMLFIANVPQWYLITTKNCGSLPQVQLANPMSLLQHQCQCFSMPTTQQPMQSEAVHNELP